QLRRSPRTHCRCGPDAAAGAGDHHNLIPEIQICHAHYPLPVPRFVLIAAYVAWPTALVLLRLITPVRPRCLMVLARGWLAATVLATTVTPAARAVPLGLIAGAGLALGIWPEISLGVTFTMAADEVYL